MLLLMLKSATWYWRDASDMHSFHGRIAGYERDVSKCTCFLLLPSLC